MEDIGQSSMSVIDDILADFGIEDDQGQLSVIMQSVEMARIYSDLFDTLMDGEFPGLLSSHTRWQVCFSRQMRVLQSVSCVCPSGNSLTNHDPVLRDSTFRKHSSLLSSTDPTAMYDDTMQVSRLVDLMEKLPDILAAALYTAADPVMVSPQVVLISLKKQQETAKTL